MTAESTERYSKRPGAETRSAVVRFWKPQSAKTGAQKPVSQRRRYEFTVGDEIAVSAPRCSRMPPIAQRPTWLGSRWSSVSGMNAFSSPRQSEMLWWQPFAETPMNGFGMKHGNDVQLAADLPADLAERREVVRRLLGPVEVEVELDLAGRVLVVALDHVEPERLPVLDHLVDDRLQLAELVDVVAVRLRDAADVGRAVRLQVQPHHLGLGAGAEMQPGRRLELGLDPLQVAAAVRGEERGRASSSSSRLRKHVHQTRATLLSHGSTSNVSGSGMPTSSAASGP